MVFPAPQSSESKPPPTAPRSIRSAQAAPTRCFCKNNRKAPILDGLRFPEKQSPGGRGVEISMSQRGAGGLKEDGKLYGESFHIPCASAAATMKGLKSKEAGTVGLPNLKKLEACKSYLSLAVFIFIFIYTKYQ